MMVLLQARLHSVKSVEFDKGCASEVAGVLECMRANVTGVELGKVFLDGLFGRAVRKVT